MLEAPPGLADATHLASVPGGVVDVPSVVVAPSEWVWDGISLLRIVWASSPPRSPGAAIGGAEQREQRLILIDRQELTVALGPALGREVEREGLDLGEEWC